MSSVEREKSVERTGEGEESGENDGTVSESCFLALPLTQFATSLTSGREYRQVRCVCSLRLRLSSHACGGDTKSNAKKAEGACPRIHRTRAFAP